MTSINIEQLSKVWPSATALEEVSLNVKDGEFVAILGPSGCGKTTLLTLLAGIYAPSSGHIYFDHVCVNEVEARFRNIGIVFQSYALYPHKTVRDNIRFPLTYRDISKQDANRLIDEMAELVEITELLERRPSQLSGGQQQRVALARALVKSPDLLLLDEPLSNLDAALRNKMRGEIRRLHKATGVTTILVTHDQSEAITLADRVVVMNAGHIEQIGKPEHIVKFPATRFVASFVGTPPMNILTAQQHNRTISLLGEKLMDAPDGDRDIEIGLNADDVSFSDQGIAGILIATEHHRREVHHFIETEAGPISVISQADAQQPKPGEQVKLSIAKDNIFLFDINTGKRLEDFAPIC